MLESKIVINDDKYDKRQLFLMCINFSNALYFLDKEDIINLSLCSKRTYSFIEDNKILIRNILYKEHSL